MHSTHPLKEEEDMALTCGAMEQWIQINPELINPELVTLTFCNVCSVYLKADHIFSGVNVNVEEQGAETDGTMCIEPYDIHVYGVSHESNVFLYRKLASILSNETGCEPYPNLRRDLTDLLKHCKELQNKVYGKSELNRCIDDIEEEIAKNEKVLEELQESCNWRKAIEVITGPMTESMDKLMIRGQKVYCKVSEEVKHRIDAELEAKQEDPEDDDIDQHENIIEREFDYLRLHLS